MEVGAWGRGWGWVGGGGVEECRGRGGEGRWRGVGGIGFEAKPNYCIRVVRLRSPEFL